MNSYVSRNFITGGWGFSVIYSKGGFRSISYETEDAAKNALNKFLGYE